MAANTNAAFGDAPAGDAVGDVSGYQFLWTGNHLQSRRHHDGGWGDASPDEYVVRRIWP